MIPSFFIIGAPKCGTTTLYTWLKSHPDIFMPEGKEPHFFAQNLSDRYCRIRSQDAYLHLFQSAENSSASICGEASVLYSFYPESIQNILAFNPKAKFIFMLRNPMEMAPSYHRQLLINLEEDIENFEEAWNLQSERKKGKHLPSSSTDPDLLQYYDTCSLGNHLDNIKNIVSEENLCVLFLDDIKTNPKYAYNQVLSFLEISNNYEPSFTIENPSRSIRFAWLQKLILNPSPAMKKLARLFKKLGLPIGKIAHTINKKEPINTKLNHGFEKQLIESFVDDIEKIERLTRQNLSHWKKSCVENSTVFSET